MFVTTISLASIVVANGLQLRLTFLMFSDFWLLLLAGTQNRSLEEFEKMFEAGISLRKFGQFQSDADDFGAAVTKLEQGDL